jgi:hypothetical protein
VVYSFSDASGSGFGGSWYNGERVAYQSGQWAEDYAARTSNFRELANLVIALEQAHERGSLRNSEVFIFTDNSTAESNFFRGTSSSRLLFELILRLQFIHLHGEIMVHFIHVAGRRMIRQGTDELSRGIQESLPCGVEFLTFVPLHLGAMERQAIDLQEWIMSWFNIGQVCRWLTPQGMVLGGALARLQHLGPSPSCSRCGFRAACKGHTQTPPTDKTCSNPPSHDSAVAKADAQDLWCCIYNPCGMLLLV